MESHGQGRRQAPRGGRPNNGGAFFPRQRRIDPSRIVEQGIAHPYGGTGMVFVLDLGLGESRLVMHAPVDRAQSLVDEPLLIKKIESFEYHRLVLRIHGGIGPIETAEDTNTLELLALQVEKLLGVLTAIGAHVNGTHLVLLAPVFLFILVFYTPAVAIPLEHCSRRRAG